ncbi:MAG: dihydrolipoyllysine-residue succinyltransferase [Verrucomicrobiota bacterium]
MANEIRIPSVGESITSGTIAEWLVEDGAHVDSGDAVLMLETDKISTEVPAEHSGIVRIQVEAGEEVDIGGVVGTIEEGDAPAETSPPPKEEPKSEKAAEPNPEPTPEPEPQPEVAEDSEVQPELKVVEPAAISVPDSDRVTRKRMSPLRRKIASHLVNAQQTAAMLTTFNEADMSEVMDLRKQLQPWFVETHGVKLGFMSFFVKAVVEALKSVPAVNGRIDGEDVIQHHFHDIGVAIGTDKGLMVPVLRDCDQKSFADIEKDIIAYAERARAGKIQLDDLQGGVFTISNGGIYGSVLSTPILNFPQSAILGMHAIQQRPIAVDGEVVIRPMMNLALSYDHRLVDGKEAVTFLVRIKECIEAPAQMMVAAK